MAARHRVTAELAGCNYCRREPVAENHRSETTTSYTSFSAAPAYGAAAPVEAPIIVEKVTKSLESGLLTWALPAANYISTTPVTSGSRMPNGIRSGRN